MASASPDAPGYGRMAKHWDVIALTSRTPYHASVYQKEFKRRQRGGLIPEQTSLLSIADPSESVSVGSGGATLNALLKVAEYLSALEGHTVVTPETLVDSRVLIIHMGGKPFTAFGATTTGRDEHREVIYNVDILMQTMGRIAKATPPGVWVCSTEMLLKLPTADEQTWTVSESGMTVVTIPGTVEDATKHGVYKVDPETGAVQNLLYRGSVDEIQATATPDGQVLLVAGVVFICPATAEDLLGLTITHPINACTYLGVDDGAESFQLSLFLDIVLCAAREATVETVERRHSAAGVTDPTRLLARRVLWEKLHGRTPVSALVLPTASFVYFPESMGGLAAMHYTESFQDDDANRWSRLTRVYVAGEVAESSVVVSSIIGEKATVGANATVCHSWLRAAWTVGANSYLHGIADTDADAAAPPRRVAPKIAVHQHRVTPGLTAARGGRTDESQSVWTLLGVDDDLSKDPLPRPAGDECAGGYCNEPWAVFFKRTMIEPNELWAPGTPRITRFAKLFPVQAVGQPVTVDDVLWLQEGVPTQTQLARWRASWRESYHTLNEGVDHGNTADWRNSLDCEVQNRCLALTLNAPTLGAEGQALCAKSGLTPSDWCLLPYFGTCAINKRFSVLEVLDDVAKATSSPGVAARTLACIADCLGKFAFGRGGLRSGPGRNAAFMPGMELLRAGKVAEGVAMLAAERKNWLGSPDALIRAARHYESAAQILISHAVMTAQEFVEFGDPDPTKAIKEGEWIMAEAAARIDLSGGWSDTPPVTYEHGGAVCNASILIDGKRPIGAKARRIAEPALVLVMGEQRITVRDYDSLATYAQPQSPGALLKAAFCCARVVTLEGEGTLVEQLQAKYGGGFELHTWSNLPQGSGLGTSSILAGVVIACLWHCVGVPFATSSLIHSVNILEQMLTTGGGWQDQVGGLVGGLIMSRSAAALPMEVKVDKLGAPPGFVDLVNRHLILIYTGKTRLARNLLQNVIRNWYAREPELVANADALVSNAEVCRKACLDGDLAALGQCMSKYWEQKKLMAPGCEPEFVRRMMDLMAPHLHGQSMAGAGGGGFMFALSKEPDMSQRMEELIRAKLPEAAHTRFHQVEIATDGILVTRSA